VGTLGGQPGIPGPQRGTGISEVVAWWLGRMRALEDETEAAAAPATTTDRAKMRIASFIVSNLTVINLVRNPTSSQGFIVI
jgi:hypothetical protein